MSKWVVLLLCFQFFFCSGQEQVNYWLNTENINENTLFESTVICKKASEPKVLGTIRYRDITNLPLNSYFIWAPTSDVIKTYRELSGSIFIALTITAAVEDEKGNIYTVGSFNNNPFINKINASGNLEWSKRQGHHSYNDIDYSEGKLAVVSQDETEFGEHTQLISIIDTNGNLLDTANFYSGGGYDGAANVEILSDGYLVAGTANTLSKERIGVFLIKTDKELNPVWSKNIQSENTFFDVQGLKSTIDDELLITGNKTIETFRKPYLLSLSSEGDLNFMFDYDVLESGNIEVIDLIKEPEKTILALNSENSGIGVLVLDQNGKVLENEWKEEGIAFHELEAMSKINDAYFFLGNYSPSDDPNSVSNSFLIQVDDSESSFFSCSFSQNVTSESIEIITSETLIESRFRGPFTDYPFLKSQLTINDETVQCADLLGIEKVNKTEITFTNPVNNEIIFFEEFPANTEISILDITGKTVLSKRKEEIVDNSIQANQLEKGLFILMIKIDKEDVQTSLLVIE